MKTSVFQVSSMLVLFVLAGILGCSPEPTNINPPSGPVETQVCFSPTPPQFTGVTGETCGWYVNLTLDERTYPHFYTYENCFDLPYEDIDFFAGDVVTVEVRPDWHAGLAAYWCDAAFPLPPLDSLGIMYGTFTVTE